MRGERYTVYKVLAESLRPVNDDKLVDGES